MRKGELSLEDKREGKLKDGRVGVEDICSALLEETEEIKQFPAFDLETVYWEGEKGYGNEKDRAK